VKLTTHLHLVPMSIIRGTMPTLSYTSLWRGVQFKIKHRDYFNLPLLRNAQVFKNNNKSKLHSGGNFSVRRFQVIGMAETFQYSRQISCIVLKKF
jgi:hypothetical protein